MSKRWNRQLALAAGIVVSFAGSARGQTDTVYARIKRWEDSLHLPRPFAAVWLGTFDAATGRFNSAITRRDTLYFSPPPRTDPGPVRQGVQTIGSRTIWPATVVNAVDVELRFIVQNSPSQPAVTVALGLDSLPQSMPCPAPTAGGVAVNRPGLPSPPPGANVALPSGKLGQPVSVCLRQPLSLRWTVRAGTQAYRDSLRIDRPPVVGAGAFIVRAIPITIVYEPPQIGPDTNRLSYSVTRSLGTTVTASLSSGSTTTHAVNVDADFQTVTDLRNAIAYVGNRLTTTGNDYAAAIGTALSVLADLLPQSQASLTTGDSVTAQHQLVLTDAMQTTYRTRQHAGPGHGDLIVFADSVKLVWLGYNGVRLAMLGYKVAWPTADFLRARWQSRTGWAGLDARDIESLLRLDPFVFGGPSGALTQPRFVPAVIPPQVAGGAGEASITVTHDVVREDRQAWVRFSTRSESLTPGFFDALSGAEGGTWTTTTTLGSSQAIREGQSVAATLDVYSRGDESFEIDSYYDRVFGTFAFQTPLVTTEILAGVARDGSGRAVAGQPVTLILGNQLIRSRTDIQGHYSLRGAGPKAGQATLKVGNLKTPIQLRAVPLRNLDLRLP